MRLEHDLSFELVVPMAYGEALAFVRDVRRSFAEADFLLDLGFETGPPPAVRAELPVAAAFLGQRSLPFRSLAEWRPRGGALVGQPMEVGGLGWAQVDGEAEVEALGEASSSLLYRFHVQVWLRLPPAEGWGGHALQRMVKRAGEEVLRRLDQAFPKALTAAARSQQDLVAVTSPRRSD